MSSEGSTTVFIVISDEKYGGDKIKVFFRYSDAENYLKNGLGNLEGGIIQCEIFSPWTKIYVAVFEECFRYDDCVRCFSSYINANTYVSEKEKDIGLNSKIIETDLLVEI